MERHERVVKQGLRSVNFRLSSVTIRAVSRRVPGQGERSSRFNTVLSGTEHAIVPDRVRIWVTARVDHEGIRFLVPQLSPNGIGQLALRLLEQTWALS